MHNYICASSITFQHWHDTGRWNLSHGRQQCVNIACRGSEILQNVIKEMWAKCDVCSHTMEMLWEKFQWILPLYIKPISFQSKASVVCSVTTAIFIDYCLKKLNVFSQHIGKKTNKYMDSAEQILKNWNVDRLSVLITSWDITQWCRINLEWKELMECMSEHTGLISSLSLLLVQTQATRWKTATPEQLTGAHLYLDLAKSGYVFHELGMLCVTSWFLCKISVTVCKCSVTGCSPLLLIDYSIFWG